jgi:hypothetical protein
MKEKVIMFLEAAVLVAFLFALAFIGAIIQ